MMDSLKLLNFARGGIVKVLFSRMQAPEEAVFEKSAPGEHIFTGSV